jgi:hypothetical protein
VRTQLDQPEVAQNFVGYLTQVPASIRASQRRPADPTGRSLGKNFSIQKVDDLVRMFPVRAPRFSRAIRCPSVGNWKNCWASAASAKCGGHGIRCSPICPRWP